MCQTIVCLHLYFSTQGKAPSCLSMAVTQLTNPGPSRKRWISFCVEETAVHPAPRESAGSVLDLTVTQMYVIWTRVDPSSRFNTCWTDSRWVEVNVTHLCWVPTLWDDLLMKAPGSRSQEGFHSWGLKGGQQVKH